MIHITDLEIPEVLAGIEVNCCMLDRAVTAGAPEFVLEDLKAQCWTLTFLVSLMIAGVNRPNVHH